MVDYHASGSIVIAVDIVDSIARIHVIVGCHGGSNVRYAGRASWEEIYFVSIFAEGMFPARSIKHGRHSAIIVRVDCGCG